MKNKTIKNTSLKKQENRFCFLLLIYPITMFMVFGIYVYISTFVLCFQKMDFLGNRTFIGFSNLFGNFKDILDSLFLDGSLVKISIINSLKSWFLCFIITNPLYLIVSYFLYKKTFGHRLVAVLVMVPEIISGLIFCLIFKKIVEGPLVEIMQMCGFKDFPNMLSSKNLSKYGYFITLFYRIWASFGSSTIFYSNAMSGIDKEVIESSEIDGITNMFQELWYIIIPLIYPTFKTLFVLSLVSIFTVDNGLVTFFMYGAPAEAYTLGYYNTVKIFNSSSMGYPVIAAGGLILTLIFTPIVLGIKKLTDRIDPTL